MISRAGWLLCSFVVLSFSATWAADAPRRPNFLVIVADDLGYSDLGCYGGEIATPNLDALAAGGLRFTQFYNTARCWPTRGALLTGYYAQQIGRDALPNAPGGARGVRPAWAPLLPAYLRPLGYRSYHSGKWHVDGTPLEGGFDHAYTVDDHNRYFNPQEQTRDGRAEPPRAPTRKSYATTAIAEQAIRYLKEHAKVFQAQPFFCHLAFNAPHFPLQAPVDDIARYKDRYGDGWDAVRAARWRRQRDMKLVAGELAPLERAIGPPYDFADAIARLGPGEVNRELPWSELDVRQQDFQAAKMRVHAAMVDRIDREVGRVVAQLRAMQALDDTVIFFLSDNGASAEIMVRGDGHDPLAAPGSAGSYLCLGPGWSRAANTPFRRHKTWVHEGGISTPLVVHWPAGIAAAGELRHAPGHVIDLAPTVVELAGGTWPAAFAGQSRPATPGRNLARAFAADGSLGHDSLWWLHEGNRAIRVGDWKLVAAKGQPWELYDLAHDRTEMHDRAAELPGRVAELARKWDETTADYERLSKATP